MIRTSTNSTSRQKMPSVENSLNVDIKSLVSDDSKEKYKIDEDALSLNQIPETISSGSSINIMVSSSSSCGNVGSSSSSSLGNQDEAKNTLLKEQTGPVVGSELSSSSRRSSISGDMETKISKESKPGKSLRKPKRVSPSKNRKARRLTRKKRDVHNEDADDDESDNVFDESGNDSALEKDFGEKAQPKFNCLDLDLFDYLLKRNFLKSMNQNQSDVKMLNSTAKQRKLSLFTASSDFKDFENNLSINKYFYELIKNGKKNLGNMSHMDENVKPIDPQVVSLMNDLVAQVEKNTLPKQTSLIKTLLHDMSSLNSIGSNDESKKVPSVESNTENLLAHDEKSSKENIEILEETKQVESNITKEDELKSMEKTSLNTKLLNSCVSDKETNLVVEVEEEKKENMSEIGKLRSGQLASKSDIVTELNGNVKKVILKNNEVVLIEDCLDDEHEEEMRLKLLKLSNKNAQELISDTVTPVPRRDKTDSMSKSQTFSMPKPSKSAGKDDDPYVKAALERFDAFCKSKSSHNLDQSAATPSFVLNRQKSPYLTRKLSATSQSEADPSVKESVSSFIKRRSARIDPNKADLTSRSASESRADSNKPFSSSSLAKKFLGSLGPQLDPPDLPPKPTKPENLVLDNSKTNSTCTSPSCLDTSSSSGQNSPTSSPTHQTKPKLIKLEVLNSKNRASSAKVGETKSLSNSPGTNKPPIPPSQASVQSNKAKNLKNTETSTTIEKNPKIQNSKPVSRIIPIEIKNSKNSTSAKVAGQRTPTKSVDRDIVSSEVNVESKNDTQSSPSIQDRIRSLSTSFRENLNERKFVRENSIGDPTSPRQPDNIYDSLIRENPIADHKPDPIVEKACNNFMTKLKEFQRLHSSQSLSYTSPTSSSISSSSSYSGPIVSARNTNPASVDYSLSAPSYKSLYSSTYSTPMSSSYYEPVSYTKYENESSSSPRPYVSAIRKRRTLFSDGFDSASTELRTDSADEFVSYTKSESDYSQYSARSECYDESKTAQARNRPLSIVSEESNAAVARSHTINNTRVKEPVKTLKKSNSINQASKTESKIRSTVFDRLSVNPTCESKACTKSSSSLSSKPPANYDIKKKEENEIAVVNSVVPKTRRESTSSIGNPSTNSSSNINRIRSLDPKNRDKFKSTASLKQNTKSNATNVAASSTNVPACYLYPCPDPKQTGVLKSASNTSTKSSEETKRKTTNKNLAESKKDVFERLSKRANSMKNLSNKSKNSSSCSSSGEEADHKALGDENDDSVFHSSQNSGSGKTSVFERLYKSNIAAHMSQDETKNTSLKKNMSVSSANLISNGQSSNQNQTSARKSNLSKNKGFINTRVSLKNRKDDSANDESNESKISDSETIKNESPRDLTKSSFLCKKLIDLYDK